MSMRIIEIAALDNGAHRNQSGNFSAIPDGWAVVPDDMECENFPFGIVTTETRGKFRFVTSWTPLPIPEPEPDPEQPKLETTDAEMAAAITEGVNAV